MKPGIALSDPRTAVLLRVLLGAALGLGFLVVSLFFGASSARADDAPEPRPGLVQGLVETVLPADSTLGSVVTAVTAKPVAVVDRVVATPIAVVERVVERVVDKVVVETVVQPVGEPVAEPAPAATVPAIPVPAQSTVAAVVAPVEASTPAPAVDRATPAEAPPAPGDSTLTPGPALGSSASSSGVAGDLESFGVQVPVASSAAFSPHGFSPPGAPTFDSDTTPD